MKNFDYITKASVIIKNEVLVEDVCEEVLKSGILIVKLKPDYVIKVFRISSREVAKK